MLGAARPHCPPMERSAQRGPDTRRAMGKLGVPGSPPICTASLRPAAPLLGSEGLTRGQHPLCSANSASVRTPGLSRPQELGRREGRSRPPWGPTRTGPWSPSCRCAGSAGTSLHFSGPQLPRLYSGHGLTPRVIGSDRGVHCKPIPALTALPSSVPAGGGQGSGPPQTALPSAAPPCSTRASARPGRPRSPPYRCRAPHPVEGHSFLPLPGPIEEDVSGRLKQPQPQAGVPRGQGRILRHLREAVPLMRPPGRSQGRGPPTGGDLEAVPGHPGARVRRGPVPHALREPLVPCPSGSLPPTGVRSGCSACVPRGSLSREGPRAHRRGAAAGLRAGSGIPALPRPQCSLLRPRGAPAPLLFLCVP